MRLPRLFVPLVFGLPSALSACDSQEYHWAFAQELNGSFHPSDVCRESLAQSVYAEANRAKTIREGTSNIFLFTGAVQSYRIHAYRTQQECETALTAMVTRARLMP